MDDRKYPLVLEDLLKRLDETKKQPFNAEAIERMALCFSLVSLLDGLM